MKTIEVDLEKLIWHLLGPLSLSREVQERKAVEIYQRD